MKLSPGTRLRSTVDETEVVVVRAPAQPVTLDCGGAPMALHGTPINQVGHTDDAQQQDGTLLGKRYVDDEIGIEVLCVKGGSGTLSVSGRPLSIREAKQLPASD